MISHEAKITRISETLRDRTGTRPLSLRKKVVSHTVPIPKDQKHSDEKIDVRDLNQILEIDTQAKICIAEPGVTFFDLVQETLKYNLVPIIVPELKTITIG
jgi:hypothetical protein